MRDFPSDFLWGSSTAAHQVEGDNHGNDWWRWERTPGTLAAEHSGRGIDHFRRFDEDFALLASLGQNAHRLSLEWSRIEPEPGRFCTDAIAHYRRVLASLDARGLTGLVTMYHKTLPLWFADGGGWLRPDALDCFERFVAVVASELGAQIPYACTINEPQILPLFGYATGQFPPALSDRSLAEDVNAVLIEAHRRAVGALRAGAGSPKIGTCLQLVPLAAHDPSSEPDLALTAWLDRLMTETHLEDLRRAGDVGDFLGVQYYTRVRVDATSPTLLAPQPAGTESTQMGWEVYPEGLGQVLRRASGAGLPLIVTENGIATSDDAQRLRFLCSHISEVKRAMDDGVDVRGYLHWSSFDNFEWNHGYAPTFGLIGIDRQDEYRRFVRPSALAFGELAATGRLAALETAPAMPTEHVA